MSGNRSTRSKTTQVAIYETTSQSGFFPRNAPDSRDRSLFIDLASVPVLGRIDQSQVRIPYRLLLLAGQPAGHASSLS